MVSAPFLRSCSLKTSVLFFVIFVLFAFECKELYMKMKKENRLAYYNEYVKQVGGDANRVEKLDNSSYIYVVRLNKLLGIRRNVTESGLT